MLWLLEEVPEEGAFVASLRGVRPPGQQTPKPPDVDSPAGQMLARRRHRGWGLDREIAAQTRDAVMASASGGKAKRFPRPESASPDRTVVAFEDLAALGV